VLEQGGISWGFDDAIKLGFAIYVNFWDRACRSEGWYWYLSSAIGP